MSFRTSFFARFLFGTLLILGLSSCEEKRNETPISNEAFQIAVLQGELLCKPKSLGASSESALNTLYEIYPESVVHRITLNDIQVYNWSEQSILLTENGAKEFQNAIREGKCPHAFLVLEENNPIYGGQITLSFVATAMNYPVIYVEQNPQKITIRPFHTIQEIEQNNPAWVIIKDKKLKDVLLKAKKLVE